LYVLYQPVVELETRRVIGAEALLRWKSRSADMRPDYFIPQAEQCGMIQLITAQVLAMVARDLPQFLKIDPHFCVAVNVSAADLCDNRTIDAMDQFLRVSGARPENVEIEATERAFLQGPETAELIDALRAKGFSVAIDDFGTGYSSLSCLQSLSLDTLKIDRAFVETINTDGATSQVVLHIIEMAHSLHLEMVAEGVETEPQAQYLLKRGVRYAQGWHFGRPMDIAPLCEQIRIHAAADDETVLVGSAR
jgi:sensor c-di-GMP phosphodiesterase-like protein